MEEGGDGGGRGTWRRERAMEDRGREGWRRVGMEEGERWRRERGMRR